MFIRYIEDLYVMVKWKYKNFVTFFSRDTRIVFLVRLMQTCEGK